MNPKEKAKELVERYINIMPNLLNQTGEEIIKHAKQCALIAVAEILKQVADTNKKTEGSNYWSFVKEEITKL